LNTLYVRRDDAVAEIAATTSIFEFMALSFVIIAASEGQRELSEFAIKKKNTEIICILFIINPCGFLMGNMELKIGSNKKNPPSHPGLRATPVSIPTDSKVLRLLGLVLLSVYSKATTDTSTKREEGGRREWVQE